MAKFVMQTPALADAFDRLENLANNFITAETARRTQVSRAKEQRQIEAYKYLIELEEKDIQENERALDLVTDNLLARGVELNNLSDEHKGVHAEDLLTAANEGTIQMLTMLHDDAKNQKQSFENKRRESLKIKRTIDIFDDLASNVNPAYAGKEHLVEAEDVAVVYNKYLDGLSDVDKELYKQYIDQRFEMLQTESELSRLQAEYIARSKAGTEATVAGTQFETIGSSTNIKLLEDIEKINREGTKTLTYDVVMGIANQFGNISMKRKEIKEEIDAMTSVELDDKDIDQKEKEINAEYARIGGRLAPWSYCPDPSVNCKDAMENAQGLEKAIKMAGGGNYQAIINYLDLAGSKYQKWSGNEETRARAETFKNELLSYLNIDISNIDDLADIEESWYNVRAAEKKQSKEGLLLGREFLPPRDDDGITELDLLMQKYNLLKK